MVDDREEVRYSKRGREMIEEKADREGGLLLLSLCSFILCRAPVSLRPPSAKSSFEVIMGLLANARLQVPLVPSRSLSPSTAI